MPRPYEERRIPYIEKRHNRYLAVLEVPRALRARYGRRFVKSLETDSLSTAQRRLPKILEGWRRQIADAQGRPAADDDVAFFQRALRDAKTEAERAKIIDVIDDAAMDIGLAHGDLEGDGPMAAPEAIDFYTRATSMGFADLLSEWLATSDVTQKTKDMQAADVKRFAEAFSTVSEVNKAAVKRWADGLRAKDGLTQKTVIRILSALRGYWKHLQSVALAPTDTKPFNELGFTAAKKRGRIRDEDQRKAFSAAEVVKLIEKARELADGELVNLIELGRWSGARIEELASLKVERVKLDATIPHFKITAGKTDAAIRDVPIHSALLPLIRELVGNRTAGFVLAGLTENKYGDRSNAIGKRFGRMKATMGFGDDYVFHSIRKTVSTLLENAGVPENVAADIIGHDKPTMTYGLYSGGASLTTMAAAIQKLTYPDTPAPENALQRARARPVRRRQAKSRRAA